MKKNSISITLLLLTIIIMQNTYGNVQTKLGELKISLATLQGKLGDLQTNLKELGTKISQSTTKVSAPIVPQKELELDTTEPVKIITTEVKVDKPITVVLTPEQQKPPITTQAAVPAEPSVELPVKKVTPTISKEKVEATKAHLAKEGFTFKEKNITAKAPATPQEPDIEKITIACDEYGYPTEEALKKLLLQKYLSAETGIKITIKEGKGGSYTGAIFTVYLEKEDGSKRAVLFLKVSKKEAVDAWKNLIKIQKSPIGRLGTRTSNASTNHLFFNKNLPIMTWAEKFYAYDDGKGNERTIEVTHAAHGIPVHDIISNINITGDQTLQKMCAKALGKAIGAFQQAFMKYVNPSDPKTWTTFAHGDLHGNNVFFDKKTSRIYFIDNETMSKSLDNPTNIWDDLGRFTELLMSQFLSYNNTKLNQIFYFYTYFIQAYIESFPQDKRKLVATCIITKGIKPYINLTGQFGEKATFLRRLKKVLTFYPDSLNERLQELLRSTTDINAQDEDGWTLLHLAATNENTNIIEELVARGAAIEAKDNIGTTPLHVAVHTNNAEAVRALIKAGANVKIKDTDFKIPIFELALNNCQTGVVAALLETPEINVNEAFPSYPPVPPLYIAINKGCHEIVKLLLTKGATVDKKALSIAKNKLEEYKSLRSPDDIEMEEIIKKTEEIIRLLEQYSAKV